MADKTHDLGERILMVARLCVEEHLRQSITVQMSRQRHVTVGGADLDWVTEDSLLLARGRAVLSDAKLVQSIARLAEGEVA